MIIYQALKVIERSIVFDEIFINVMKMDSKNLSYITLIHKQ